MEVLSHSLFNNSSLANLLDQTIQDGINARYGIQTKNKVKAELEITTAEGDRVTLLSQTKTREVYAGYDSMGNLEGTDSSVSAGMYKIVSTNKVTIAVEGNLSEEELADIQRLLQAIEDTFVSFITDDGSLDEFQASSISLDSLTTISHFDAELKYSQKIKGYGVVAGSTDQIADQATAPAPSPDMMTMMAFKSKTKASMHISGTRIAMEAPAQPPSAEMLPADSSTDVNPPAAGSDTGSSGAVMPTLSSSEITAPEPVLNTISIMSLRAMMKTSVKINSVQLQPTPATTNVLPEADAPVQSPAPDATSPAEAEAQATPNQSTSTDTSANDTLSILTTYRTRLVEEFSALIQGATINTNSIAPVLSEFIPSLISNLNDTYMLTDSKREALQQMGNDLLSTPQTSATV